MGAYIKNIWEAENQEAVCRTQNLASAGDLLLNGDYYNPSTTTVSFINKGFVRQATINSVNNLSAVNFTISGVQNKTVVTETIAGPNNGSAQTSEPFDIISSVSADGPVSGVSVGTGWNGFFPIIKRVSSAISFSSPSSNFALGFSTSATTGCSYQIYVSLTDNTDNGETYMTLLGDESFLEASTLYDKVTQILQRTDVCNNILIRVNSSAASSFLTMEFLQL